MVCPECGFDHSSEACPQTGTAAPAALPLSEEILDQLPTENVVEVADSLATKPTSRLIEFPGVTRRSVPPWRKELSERVREVQERRAHEAAAEAELAEQNGEEPTHHLSPQLELLPQAESAPVNPLVTAALRRIERAHQATESSQTPAAYPASLTAAAGVSRTHRETSADVSPRRAVAASLFEERAGDPETRSALGNPPSMTAAAATAMEPSEKSRLDDGDTSPERGINLVVVPPVPVVVESAIVETEAQVNGKPVAEPDPPKPKPKPRRIISDDSSDPALNYLDFVGVSCEALNEPTNKAPLFRRLVSGFIDLLAVTCLCLPIAAVVELRNLNWHEPRIVAVIGGAVLVVMFIYLTVSTALTGKTLGLKVLSLRVIDTRTRLIPTGTQAASRAIVYILSLVTAGVGFLYAFARGEGKTVHDRCSGTAVVRD